MEGNSWIKPRDYSPNLKIFQGAFSPRSAKYLQALQLRVPC